MTRWMALSLLMWLPGGCSAQNLTPPVAESAPTLVSPDPLPERQAEPRTHRAVAEPPSIQGDNPVLWVSLASRLGVLESSPSLNLQSAGSAPLVLRDASGAEWIDSALRLRWRRMPLDQSQVLARQVAGPFASFESADRVAQRWRAVGAPALVAHPQDWEVWAPPGAPAPEDLELRSWSKTLDAVVQPVLETADGSVLLKGPLKIQAADGLRWNRGVFQGPFRLQRDAYESWTLVEQVPVERYLEGVVPHEIGAGSPTSALQAQTVLARTWALANSHRFRIDGYHLCSDTQCQVYSDPRHASPSVRQAIRATAGEVLLWNGKPIHAVYHASNGGVSALAEEAWAMEPLPYVKALADGETAWSQSIHLPLQSAQDVQSLLNDRAAYGAGHPRFRWIRDYSAGQLAKALAAAGQGNAAPTAMTVLKRGPSGRVLALQIDRERGAKPVVLKLDAIRRTLRRLPSTLFIVESGGAGTWRFQGGGFGHGVGLSQAGAIDLAGRGWTVQRILQHYYPGTQLGPFSAPAGTAPAEAP